MAIQELKEADRAYQEKKKPGLKTSLPGNFKIALKWSKFPHRLTIFARDRITIVSNAIILATWAIFY